MSNYREGCIHYNLRKYMFWETYKNCKILHSCSERLPSLFTAWKRHRSRLFHDQTVSSHFFSHTFVEKIEKSINLLPVCKLYPTLLALLSHTASSDKKSTQLNSNVSSQSNRSTVLQAKLLQCYDSGKPEFKAGKRFKLRKHQISDIVFFRNVLVHLTSLLV